MLFFLIVIQNTTKSFKMLPDQTLSAFLTFIKARFQIQDLVPRDSACNSVKWTNVVNAFWWLCLWAQHLDHLGTSKLSAPLFLYQTYKLCCQQPADNHISLCYRKTVGLLLCQNTHTERAVLLFHVV